MINICLSFNLRHYSRNSWIIRVNFLIGYYIIPRNLSIGIGLGIDGYNNPDLNTAPLYINIHYFFKQTRNTPYIYGAFGTLVKFGVIFERGIYGRLAFGYTFFVTPKLKIILDFSYTPVGISLTDQTYFNSADRLAIQGYGLSLGFVLF